MARGRVGEEPAIEEVRSDGRAAGGPAAGGGRPGRSPGDVDRLRAGIRRWLPVVAVGGLAVLIVGAGLLGPKVPAPEAVDGGTPTAEPGASSGPGETPFPGASPPGEARVPGLRLRGRLPEDRLLLLGGRWVDLATGTIASETGCEFERPLVLAGGRIVCVAQQAARPPGSTRATYELSVVMLGRSRPATAEPWASPPPRVVEGLRPAVPLTTLVGRRDLAFGSPVAVALAPGAESDTLLLAWAVLGDDGYRVGLDRYRVGDAGAVATGSREVLALPLEDDRGPTSLADLVVSVSPDGRTALVGVTVAGTPPAPAERRLAVVRVDAGAVTGGALGPPVVLPLEVASNATGPAEVARDVETACGGALGEGFATDDTLFLVCPGRPSAFRRVAILQDPAGRIADPRRAPVAAAILDETVLTPGSGATALGLVGNGVAIDRTRGRYYRWSPSTRTLWSIDLAVRRGARPTVRSVTLAGGVTPPDSASPEDGDRAERPVLALDVLADRVYLLAPDAAGRGARIEVVSGVDLASRGSRSTSPEPYATMALSPDGRLLYLATPAREVAGAPRPLVAVEVLDSDPLAERLFAGRLPPGAWDPAQVLVVR
ncbi:MAG TPA: hypothetical protein VER83_00385 [Candidatus Nanopelagicales bacterium]|nr:hypothetical protein [Candidatus Nanopelagicales bacterium]